MEGSQRSTEHQVSGPWLAAKFGWVSNPTIGGLALAAGFVLSIATFGRAVQDIFPK